MSCLISRHNNPPPIATLAACAGRVKPMSRSGGRRFLRAWSPPREGNGQAMARPDPGSEMKRLAGEFVALMRELDWELDFSEQSVQTLEEMIERQFEDWRP